VQLTTFDESTEFCELVSIRGNHEKRCVEVVFVCLAGRYWRGQSDQPPAAAKRPQGQVQARATDGVDRHVVSPSAVHSRALVPLSPCVPSRASRPAYHWFWCLAHCSSLFTELAAALAAVSPSASVEESSNFLGGAVGVFAVGEVPGSGEGRKVEIGEVLG